MEIIPVLAKITAEERDAVEVWFWILRGLLFAILLTGYFSARCLAVRFWRVWRQRR